MKLIHPVLLCGGSGSRLWPLSRAQYPKQLLALVSEHSLLQEAALRVRGPQFAAPVVICNEEHRFLVSRQLAEVGITPAAMLLEPEPRNTAAAVAVAALQVDAIDRNGIAVVFPTDQLILEPARLVSAVCQAAPAARRAIVTFGIRPTRPETGYGYIQRGDAGDDSTGTYRVGRFTEKPQEPLARTYVAAGDYFWNSGIFLFATDVLLDEMRQYAPQILDACAEAFAGRTQDLGFTRLANAFVQAESISIDRAVMERTGKAELVPIEMGWSDLGSWSSVSELGLKDAAGNVIVGDVLAVDVRNSYIRSDGPVLGVLGIQDAVVVATDDAVLVTQAGRAQDVGKLVAALQAAGRSEHVSHVTVHRPWGTFKLLGKGPGFLVKLITVLPGAKLSLQLHHQRAEHWVVISGRATVTRGEEVLVLDRNQSTYIPIGTRHRLENAEPGPLNLIEVQTGGYLGEDDIVRFADAYGR